MAVAVRTGIWGFSMSKAAELANLIGNINAGGGGVNRNVIVNGAMNVAQRATTVTGLVLTAHPIIQLIDFNLRQVEQQDALQCHKTVLLLVVLQTV